MSTDRHRLAEEADFISSKRAAEEFGAVFRDRMNHDDTRRRIREIIDDYVGSVDFMKKVREYAGMEIDGRMFTSGKYYLTAIVTAVVTSAIGLLLTKLLG